MIKKMLFVVITYLAQLSGPAWATPGCPEQKTVWQDPNNCPCATVQRTAQGLVTICNAPYNCAANSAGVYQFWCAATCNDLNQILVTTPNVANTGMCIPACAAGYIYSTTLGACSPCPAGTLTNDNKTCVPKFLSTSTLSSVIGTGTGNPIRQVMDAGKPLNSVRGGATQLYVLHVITGLSSPIDITCPTGSSVVNSPMYYSPNPGVSGDNQINNSNSNGGTEVYRCLETFMINDPFYKSYQSNPYTFTACPSTTQRVSAGIQKCIVSPDCVVHASANTNTSPITVSTLCPGKYLVAASFNAKSGSCGADVCGSDVYLTDSNGTKIYGTSAPNNSNRGCLMDEYNSKFWTNQTGLTIYRHCDSVSSVQLLYDVSDPNSTENPNVNVGTTIAPGLILENNEDGVQATYGAVTLDLQKF